MRGASTYILGLPFVLSCWCTDEAAAARAQAEAQKARSSIAAELRPGSSAAEIKEFGDRHHWHLGFDADQGRFQANIYTTQRNTHDVLVFIHVNAKQEFVAAEVEIAETVP
jgi:hypothetical protein